MTDNLIHRLEAAEGPSRELDAEIACLIKFPDLRPARPDDFDGEFGYSPGNIKVKHGFLQAEHYTASLDAAVSLVEGDGWGWEIDSLDPLEPSAIVGQSGICEAETPALALLIAFFKARAAVKALEAENG